LAAEVARSLRFINVLLGAWLAVAPWILRRASAAATLTSIVIGLALLGLSLPRGERSEHYAGWDRFVL
jgi:hypothetical protein